MRRVLVLSPHLDDAALSAGQFLAGRPDTVVTTIFAGVPRGSAVTTVYDAKCGFRSADEALKARKLEDQEAMAILGSTSNHLGFIDSQYGRLAEVESLAKAIGHEIEDNDPEYVVGPLGLVHQDHELLRQALLKATEDLELPVWLYEDLPSRVTAPESVTQALADIQDDGYDIELGFIGTGPLDKKMTALWCYRSQMQLPEFENTHILLVPERFWNVRRAGDATS